MKVLVVDDDADIGRALRRLLRGMDVTVCTSAAEALTAFAREQPDRVVCDQNMPGMSGVDLIREIKRRSPETICVLMSGVLDVDAPFIDGVLEKPWPSDVATQLQRVSLQGCRENGKRAP